MLSTIPNEILLLIAGHLSSHKDTLSLACCCHQFHAVLSTQVFTILEFKEWSLWHLTSLTHLFARSPKLAQAVRVLRLNIDSYSPCSDILYDHDTIQPLLEAATSASSELTAWEKALKGGADGGYDSWMAVLLPLLPNLEELVMRFEHPSTYLCKMIQRFNQDAADTTLSQLREVTVSWWDTEMGLPSSYILPFFKLPSLRIFRGHMLEDGYRDWEEMGIPDYYPGYEGREEDEDNSTRYPGPQHFSNVTHLHLYDSNSKNGFPDLISAPKRLESFAYEHSGQNGDLDPLNPPGFYKSLCKQKESLEEITLCESMESFSPDDDLLEEFMGSFVDFVALKKLRLRGQNILDWPNQYGEGGRNVLSDVLPVSLESLIIEAFDECDSVGLTTHLENLVRGVEVRIHCPNLGVLEIKGQMCKTYDYPGVWPKPLPKMEPKYPEMTANLAALCRSAGIQFRLWDPWQEE